jgi:hypothetical protein
MPDEFGEDRIGHFATVGEFDDTGAAAGKRRNQLHGRSYFASIKERDYAEIQNRVEDIQTHESSHFEFSFEDMWGGAPRRSGLERLSQNSSNSLFCGLLGAPASRRQSHANPAVVSYGAVSLD